jgi:hypothetical protein
MLLFIVKFKLFQASLTKLISFPCEVQSTASLFQAFQIDGNSTYFCYLDMHNKFFMFIELLIVRLKFPLIRNTVACYHSVDHDMIE